MLTEPVAATTESDRPEIDRVLLPDQPYAFATDDGSEAFHNVPPGLRKRTRCYGSTYQSL